MPLYNDETDGFFENSAFVGDSIMVGFERYCRSMGDGFLSDPVFLAAGSFSLWQAVSPVSESTLHPVYQGEKMLIEDAVEKSGVSKVFICLGGNDLGWKTIDESVDNYNTLIYRIHTKAPKAKIYIIGLTYMYGPSQKTNLNNTNMRTFNGIMYEYCQKYDYLEFINIGDRLIDSDNGLKAEYTSDEYIHVNAAGYDVWVKVLRANANYFMRVEAAALSEGEEQNGQTETKTDSSEDEEEEEKEEEQPEQEEESKDEDSEEENQNSDSGAVQAEPVSMTKQTKKTSERHLHKDVLRIVEQTVLALHHI
ncbi:MAG: GDSL-type esterase/lipase family protein [Clostridiales bacterium]|nr:GDSL-type esterase/lipase family protein [Clostridiales bacterium]